MNQHRPIAIPVALFAASFWVSFAAFASAATLYDEDVQGDLSGNFASPTPLALLPGENSLFAITGSTTTPDSSEYFSVSLPIGYQLSRLKMMDYFSSDGQAFIAVQNGGAFTFPASQAFPNINNMLGYSHFGPEVGFINGDDLLPAMGQNSLGFTPPLKGSLYTFWLQQTGADTGYQLDFIVTPVPEPAMALWLMPAGAYLTWRKRRSISTI